MHLQRRERLPVGLERGVTIAVETVATIDSGGKKTHELSVGNHHITLKIPGREWPCPGSSWAPVPVHRRLFDGVGVESGGSGLLASSVPKEWDLQGCRGF